MLNHTSIIAKKGQCGVTLSKMKRILMKIVYIIHIVLINCTGFAFVSLLGMYKANTRIWKKTPLLYKQSIPGQ